jgi:hypothetical protein
MSVGRLPDGSLMPEEHEEDLCTIERRNSELDIGTPESTMSLYGSPQSVDKLLEDFPVGDAGHIWHAQLVSDDYKDPKNTLEDGSIKPRRGMPMVKVGDFFSSLVQLPDGRFVFSGILNGWPAFQKLELRSITAVTSTLGKQSVKRLWNAGEGAAPPLPPDPKYSSVRATLRMPCWSRTSWSAASSGHTWWYFLRDGDPRLEYGSSFIINRIQKDLAGGAVPQMTDVHMISHRYALGPGKRETTEDRLTYHSFLLLEWDHGRHTTVLELGLLNGVGGYKGKVNWCNDKEEPMPSLYKAMPSELVQPWVLDCAEIRVTDHASKSVDEFLTWMQSYEGMDKRFIDIRKTHSGQVRLTYRSQEDLVRYLCNYASRDTRYSKEFRNCQSFACDCYCFLAAKTGIDPFSRILRPTYKNRSHLFRYQPDLFVHQSKPLAPASDEARSCIRARACWQSQR